jgi:glycosyltransferase involved in cell wall biosynthesis
MRVLLVANTCASMVWFRLPLLRELVARGHRVWVLAPEGPGVDRIHETGAHFLPLAQVQGWGGTAENAERQGYADPSVDLATIRAIRRTCRVVRPDLVLNYTHKLTVLGALGARAAGVRRVHGMVTGFGLANDARGVKGKVLREVFDASLRVAGRLSDSIIVLNDDNERDLLERKVVPREKLWRMDGEGVDLSRFSGTPTTWSAGEASFLLVGRLVRFKGVGEYVDAARQVKRLFPKARFRIAGGADYSHPASIPKAEVDRWAGEGVVEWLGHVDDVRPVVAAADVFCLPSYATEGLPVSILEAMAMGKAILTTTSPGNRETVVDGRNGLLVPPGDVPALAAAMIRLLSDPSLASMGGESQRYVAERFGAATVNGALLAHLGL